MRSVAGASRPPKPAGRSPPICRCGSIRRPARVIVLTETRRSWESPGDRQVIRLMARSGRTTVEALSGARVATPTWERAGEIEESAYVGLVSQLLDSPALLEEWPPQVLDP